MGLLKLIPGTEDALAEFMLDRYDGLIIESFGVGGLPEYDGGHLYDVVRRGVERGKIVVMTTQVPNEGSDLTVYHVGGHLKSTLRLLEAYDMTTEAAVAKLMWIMGQTREFSEVERLFYQLWRRISSLRGRIRCLLRRTRLVSRRSIFLTCGTS